MDEVEIFVIAQVKALYWAKIGRQKVH